MEHLILLDTTELLRMMPRKLHAAWAELSGTKARMPPTVGLELAPNGIQESRNRTLSVAEDLLRPGGPKLDDDRRKQLEQQAWWAAMWRDPHSPYEKMELSREQRQLHATLLTTIGRECFPTANPVLLADNRDTRIVCETISLGGKMLLTSNMRTIDHVRLNDWTVENGDRLGFKAEPVVFQADDVLVEWTRSHAGRERWIQAGLIASWPARDDADPDEVIRATLKNVGNLVCSGGPLPNASARLINELENHPDPVTLVERTRRRFPSPTVVTDRLHPTYPQAREPATPSGAASGAAAAAAQRGEGAGRRHDQRRGGGRPRPVTRGSAGG